MAQKMLKSMFAVLRRAPRPPYSEQWYWDKVYRETAGRYLEWGELEPQELFEYKWAEPQGDAFLRNLKGGKLEEHVGLKDSMLVLGCGNSTLSEEMRLAGWRGNILSTDFAHESVEQARARSEARGAKSMKWLTADVCELHKLLPPASFDVALDKGLLDALYCSQNADTMVPKAKDSVLKLLKPGGRWVCLLNGGVMGLVPPTEIDKLMEDYRWKSLQIRRLAPADLGLYFYIWTKSTKVK